MIFRVLSFVLVLTASLGQAQTRLTNPLVVELFTSQGCVMCPPADAMLAELVEERQVLGLSFHVAYWDYRGWSDPYALSESLARQEAYAAQLDKGYVYTPQFVVMGRQEFMGEGIADIRTALEQMSAQPRAETLSVDWLGEGVQLSRIGDEDLSKGLVLWRVRFHGRLETHVEQGYNQGRQLVNIHTVYALESLGAWSASATHWVELSADAGHGVALLVQDPLTGRVRGAAAILPAP